MLSGASREVRPGYRCPPSPAENGTESVRSPSATWSVNMYLLLCTSSRSQYRGGRLPGTGRFTPNSGGVAICRFTMHGNDSGRIRTSVSSIFRVNLPDKMLCQEVTVPHDVMLPP